MATTYKGSTWTDPLNDAIVQKMVEELVALRAELNQVKSGSLVRRG